MSKGINDVIKKIVIGVLDTMQLSTTMRGTVLTANPLSIQVDQKLVLEEPFLTQLDHIRGLAEGDAVILLRAAGGQDFTVLGKVMEDGVT